MKKIIFPIILLFFSSLLFFRPLFFENKLPIPSDTIVGLYSPYRDMYAKEYPRGVPFKNFLITDPVRQQYPWKSLVVESFKQYQLPLWNPYNFAGTPLLANFQSAPFYPLNIIFFLLPFSSAWSIFIFLQPVMAMLFMYLYLQNLRLSKPAGFLGAISFGFCGFFVSWLEWGNILSTALWLPLVLLLIDKLMNDKKKLLWSIFLFLSLSASFFAGHLQIFFYSSTITVLYFLMKWVSAKRPLMVLLWFGFTTFLFICVSLPQLLPTLQFIQLSGRNIDQVNWQNIEGWFIPWQHLIQFVAPDFFGNPTTLNYWGTWNYGELVGYVGILPLVMGLYALFFRRDRKTFFFGTVFFLALLFSLPTIFGTLPYLLQLPFLSTSQPTRLLFVIDFSLCILAALGIDWFMRQHKKVFVLFPLVFIGIVLGGLWLFVLQSSGENILVAQRNLYLPTLLFVFIFAIIVISMFIKNKKVFFIMMSLLLVISFVDQLRFAQKFTPFTQSEYLFPKTSVLSFLRKDTDQFRIMTTDATILPPNFSIMYHLQSVDGYDPLYLLRYGELMAASERGKADIHPPFGFNRIIKPGNVDSPIIDLLGVKYVLSFSELPQPRFTKVFEEGQTKVYRNNNALPRTFFVEEVQATSNRQQTISELFEKTNDLKKTAFVEDWKGKKEFAPGEIRIIHYSENKITLESLNEKEGFLVLTDTFYPVWHAKICPEESLSCQKTEIYLTDYNFRGIVVPPGKNRIEFFTSLL